ncbi:MAG: M18 family aminopeptidase [Candidatus Wallbacteria bacterium HGW-Wallbacteria-1]|jgi:aspartyl aminopeptidase|uniref:M18 family aminopeptidase n=1 Tax=Candidatus Wallbacteria bacterium HGW-Wallbacteria-1 TaxID=2013854 RepID=A0A2N1PNX4_9BACT|nr:MAG: M18 family aminopeptidase [Candidatus Wallbacteria bacterium HGW-Wallbacteria-1]
MKSHFDSSMDMKARDFALDLIDFIDRGPTQFHVAALVSSILKSAGFERLDPVKEWKISPCDCCFMPLGESGVIAFRAGKLSPWEKGFRIVGAHTDTPGFKIKPQPFIRGEGNSIRLNTEVYGGPIYSTWFDRPLAIAGRVIIKGDNEFQPCSVLLDTEKPVAVIPNLSFHMNREVNNGVAINPQTDTLPMIMSAGKMVDEPSGDEKSHVPDFNDFIASRTGVKSCEITGYDLFLHEASGGSLTGMNEELISSGRLDDLTSVHAGLRALLHESEPMDHWTVLALFDSEEIGSDTPWGAGSPNFAWLLERCCIAMGGGREHFMRAVAASIMISADSAHGVHGAKPDRHDPTSRPVINCGPVLKSSAAMKYITTAESGSVLKQLCSSADIPLQEFVNRSDLKGGSTIGPIVSTNLPLRAIDMGTPLMAMHSIRELGGVYDHFWFYRCLMEFMNK